MAIDEKLLEILACPACKGDVTVVSDVTVSDVTASGDGAGLICEKCKLLYPIVDDIPVMIVEEAKSI